MLRKLTAWSVLLLSLLSAGEVHAQFNYLMSQQAAGRIGLERAWFARVEREPIAMTYHSGRLYVQTDKAVVHAIDAETGRTLWSAEVGNPLHPSLPPAANEQYVAAINGSYLYLLDANTGGFLWRRQCVGSPSSGAALSKTHAFVPMLNGVVEGFPLDGAIAIPWTYRSIGHTYVQPVVTAKTISWTTDRGYLYVGGVESLGIRFRLEAAGGIESRPAYWTPYFYATSHDGFLYAVHEKTGRTAWKFSTGDRIAHPPVVINDRIYVTPDIGGLFCLDTNLGNQVWYAVGISKFLAASPTRIYAMDRQGRMVALDAKNGGLLGWLPIPGMTLQMINSHTDRIYLANDSGLIECLREKQLPEPILYIPPVDEKKADVPAEPPADAPPSDAPPDAAPPANEPNPFGAPPAAAPPAAAPPAAPPAADNPFG